jgi:two-component system response regulator RegX3
MDRGRHEVTARGEVVDLTPTEYLLLEMLMARPGRVMGRRQLLDGVWNDYYGSGKTLDVHIRHLRKKIEADPSRPALIVTVRGTGYKLVAGRGEKADA